MSLQDQQRLCPSWHCHTRPPPPSHRDRSQAAHRSWDRRQWQYKQVETFFLKLHRQSYATARLRPCGVATSFAHCTSYEYNLSRVAYDSSAFRKARTTTNTTPKSRRHAKIKPKNHMTPRLPGCGRRHLLYSNRRRLQDCKHRSGARKWGPERAPAFATYLPSHLLHKKY